MTKHLRYITLLLGCFVVMHGFAQNNTPAAAKSGSQDSVIQLYGVVMSADSLRALPGASITVVGTGRGTLTNEYGVFSIVVMKGDKVQFSYIGFKEKVTVIPVDLNENQYSLVQLMVNDTAYLPATIIKSRPTREQFERDFVNTPVPNDQQEIARQNTEMARLRILMASLPKDGQEAVNQQFRAQAQKAYYAGQTPPMQVLNPAAWAEFIKAWKRGDFKKKKN